MASAIVTRKYKFQGDFGLWIFPPSPRRWRTGDFGFGIPLSLGFGAKSADWGFGVAAVEYEIVAGATLPSPSPPPSLKLWRASRPSPPQAERETGTQQARASWANS